MDKQTDKKSNREEHEIISEDSLSSCLPDGRIMRLKIMYIPLSDSYVVPECALWDNFVVMIFNGILNGNCMKPPV